MLPPFNLRSQQANLLSIILWPDCQCTVQMPVRKGSGWEGGREGITGMRVYGPPMMLLFKGKGLYGFAPPVLFIVAVLLGIKVTISSSFICSWQTGLSSSRGSFA